MSFFDPPPPPPDLERPRQPEWIAPPEDVLGVPVPLLVVLARTERLAVVVMHPTAYPTGFEFRLRLTARSEDDELDPRLFHPRRVRAQDAFRFGIQFSDGRKATNTARGFPPARERPEPPLLVPRGGGGGGRSWDMGVWIWGLPTPGPLAFVCAWAEQALPETRVEVDAQPILDAADRAERLWPVDGGGEPA